MLKTLNCSCNISALLLHQSEIGPELRHIGLDSYSLLVVVGRGRIIPRRLSLLSLGKHGFNFEGRRLLAESDHGSGQQNERESSGIVHEWITSRIFLPTGRLCLGTQL